MESSKAGIKKKGITLGTIVLSTFMGMASPRQAYAPQEQVRAASAQKTESVQEKEQAAEQEQKPAKSTEGVFYLVDCPECPGMDDLYNTYFILPHNNVYEITIMPGDSFYRYQQSEEWPKWAPQRSTMLITSILQYVNKKPFDHINLVAGTTMRVADIDGDGYGMGRSMEFYGRRLTAEEMEETQKHNREYGKANDGEVIKNDEQVKK